MDRITSSSALATLFHVRFTSDEQLHDYGTSQAYRSLCHALTAPTSSEQQQPSTFNDNGDPQQRGLTDPLLEIIRATSRGGHFRQVSSFLFSKLAVEEGSQYGEGNDIPCVKSCFPSLLRKRSEILLGDSVHRKEQMGLVILLRDVVEMISFSYRRGGDSGRCFLVSTLFEFTAVCLETVVPLAARIAEESCTDDGAPTRLAVEANQCVLFVASVLMEDLALADAYHSGKGSQSPTKSLVVVDTSLGPLVWSAAPIVRNAVCRHNQWLHAEALSLMKEAASLLQQDCSAHEGDEEAVTTRSALMMQLPSTDRWFLSDVIALWDEHGLQSLRKLYERLDAARSAAERAYGSDARDARELQSAMWTQTIRLCLTVSSFVDGIRGSLQHSCEGDSYDETEGQKRATLHAVMSHISHIKPLESRGQESEEPLLVAHARLAVLSISSHVFFSFPLDYQQQELWAADATVTQAVHSALMNGALKYQDPLVMRMSALVSSSILRSAARGGIEQQAMQLCGDELLALLSDSSADDGASESAIHIVCQGAMYRPHAVIPSLFKLLSSSDKNSRRNALRVIGLLPTVVSEELNGDIEGTAPEGRNGPTEAGGAAKIKQQVERRNRSRQEQLRGVLQLLANELLLRIGEDEELDLRLQAANCFRLLVPVDVLPPLIHIVLKRDSSGQRRGSATKAIRSVLANLGLDGWKRLSTFLLCVTNVFSELSSGLHGSSPTASLRKAIQTAPNTPGEVLSHSLLHRIHLDDVDTMHLDDSSQGVAGSSTAPSASPLLPGGNVLEVVISKILRLSTQLLKGSLDEWFASRGRITPHDSVAQELLALFNVVKEFGLVDDGNGELRQQLCIRVVTTCMQSFVAHMQTEPLGSCQPLLDPLVDGCTNTILERVGVEPTTPQCAGGNIFAIVLSLLTLRSVPLNVAVAFVSDPQQCTLIRHLVCSIAVPISGVGAVGATFPGDWESVRRVALEVLTRMAPHHTLPALVHRMEECGSAGDEDAATVALRAYLFCYSQYVTSDECLFGTSAPVHHNNNAERAVFLLQHSTSVLHRNKACFDTFSLNELIVGVLCGGGAPSSNQKLRLASLDTSAIALVAVLVNKLRTPPTGLALPIAELGVEVSQLALAPLQQFAAFLRLLRNASTVEAVAKDASTCPSRCLIAMAVIDASVKMIKSHADCVSLCSLWASEVFPLLVECANASIAARKLSTAHLAQLANAFGPIYNVSEGQVTQILLGIALKAISILFSFLVGGKKIQQDSTKDVMLQPAEEAALLSLTIGCLQHEEIPAVQMEGVKLAGAVMAAAPSAFERLSDGRERLNTMIRCLGKISAMHPIAQARQLAESILTTITPPE